jgi:hypothetical protein
MTRYPCARFNVNAKLFFECTYDRSKLIWFKTMMAAERIMTNDLLTRGIPFAALSAR